MQTTTLWVGWIARMWSIISIGLLLMFFVGEGIFDPHMLPPTPSEWIMLLFFPAGVIVGMVESWRYEKAGGLITVFSLIVFYVINLVLGSGDFKNAQKT